MSHNNEISQYLYLNIYKYTFSINVYTTKLHVTDRSFCFYNQNQVFNADSKLAILIITRLCSSIANTVLFSKFKVSVV